jgi:hypothetical protein
MQRSNSNGSLEGNIASPRALAFGKALPKKLTAKDPPIEKKTPVVKSLRGRGGRSANDEGSVGSLDSQDLSVPPILSVETACQTKVSIEADIEVDFISLEEMEAVRADRDELEQLVAGSLNTIAALKEKVISSYTCHTQ